MASVGSYSNIFSGLGAAENIVQLVVVMLVGMSLGFFLRGPVNTISEIVKGSGQNTSSDILPPKPDRVPRHLAVIMDGNRRFGRMQHSDPLKGHWAGGQTLVDFVQWCMNDGIEILTVYAFSTENWSREPLEVQTLMTIFAKYAESFKQEALSRNVHVRVISTDFDRLPANVITAIHELETATKQCNGFHMNICLSYGGRAEIVNACRRQTQDVIEGKLKIEDIREATFNEYLCTKGMPDPDAVIRTSGEFRISNFLCWQSAYTEFFFIDKYWPQLTQADLRNILVQFNDRKRRFGK